MKALKLTFILLDFLMALAFSFVGGMNQNKCEIIDDYIENYEQSN